MKSKYKILLIVTPIVFLLDLFTKGLVLQNIPFGESVSVIPGFLDLVHVRNSGAAFGMFAGFDENFRTPFFYLIYILALGILFYCFRTLKEGEHFYPFILSLIAAGVVGNGTDRIRFGNVVDFISVHFRDEILWGIELRWPAFNVADSAITVAAVLLVLHTLKK